MIVGTFQTYHISHLSKKKESHTHPHTASREKTENVGDATSGPHSTEEIVGSTIYEEKQLIISSCAVRVSMLRGLCRRSSLLEGQSCRSFSAITSNTFWAIELKHGDTIAAEVSQLS